MEQQAACHAPVQNKKEMPWATSMCCLLAPCLTVTGKEGAFISYILFLPAPSRRSFIIWIICLRTGTRFEILWIGQHLSRVQETSWVAASQMTELELHICVCNFPFLHFILHPCCFSGCPSSIWTQSWKWSVQRAVALLFGLLPPALLTSSSKWPEADSRRVGPPDTLFGKTGSLMGCYCLHIPDWLLFYKSNMQFNLQ